MVGEPSHGDAAADDRSATTGGAAARRTLGYRPALDGIRALAVLAVIGYHEGWARTPAGFLGVDMFLVLSGFLITYLLTQELLRTGTVSRRQFWTRRARRLLPALFLVLAAVALYGALAGTAAERATIRSDGIAALLYVQNWHLIAQGHSYFAQFSAPSPFLHMWSLAIEEQWYLVWPLLLLGLFRVTGNRLGRVAAITATLALGSAVLMWLLYSPGHDPSRVYFGTDTRAQALLVGAVLAFVVVARPRLGRGRARVPLQLLGGLGAAYLAYAIVRTAQTSPRLYHGGFMLVALAAAAVVAAALVPGPVARLLALPPLPAIGRISYGLYLWSWPITVYLTAPRAGVDGRGLTALRIGLTFVVATLSYLLVERPIRNGTWPLSRRPVVWVPAGAVVVAAVLVIGTSGLVAARPPTAVEAIAAAAATPRSQPSHQPVPPRDAGVPRVFVTGDSITFTLSLGFPSALAHQVQQTWLAFPGCAIEDGDGVVDGVHQPRSANCEDRFDLVAQAVRRNRPDVAVLLPTAWDVFDRAVGDRTVKFGSPQSEALLVHALDEERAALTSTGAPFLLLTEPCFGVYADLTVFGARQRAEPWRVDWLNGVLRRYAARHPGEVTLADLHARLCPRGQYSEDIDGVRMRADGVHLTLDGGAYVWSWLTPIVRDLARRHPLPAVPAT